MHTKLSRTKKVVVGTGVVLSSMGIGAAGFALSSGGSAGAASTPSASTTQNRTRAPMFVRFLRSHAVDATVTLKTKSGFETLSLARGTVTAYANGQITVTPPAGSAVQGTVTSTTKFHNTSAQTLATGDRVAIGVRDGNVVVVAGPKPAAS